MKKNLKGIKGGNCNRTDCQQPGAIFYNHSTQKYYCGRCALDLNLANKVDALRLYGHDLCQVDNDELDKAIALTEHTVDLPGSVRNSIKLGQLYKTHGNSIEPVK